LKKKSEDKRATVIRRKPKITADQTSPSKKPDAEPASPKAPPETLPETPSPGVCLRLQKFFSQAGIMSRRAAEDAILLGRVALNGRVVTTMGVQIDPTRDEVRLDGNLVTAAQTLHYLLFYKPKHCVTTLSDPQGRKTIMDCLPSLDVRVFPVGRLDYDAEGALILTNDGRLAHRLQHPRFGVPKVYEVKVQGWYRQLKRMGEAVGHPVLKIKRIAYGPLTLGRMKPGDWRPLTASERRALEQSGSDSGAGRPRR
jgi:23S rRNA pseudouridine2605 synthase